MPAIDCPFAMATGSKGAVGPVEGFGSPKSATSLLGLEKTGARLTIGETFRTCSKITSGSRATTGQMTITNTRPIQRTIRVL